MPGPGSARSSRNKTQSAMTPTGEVHQETRGRPASADHEDAVTAAVTTGVYAINYCGDGSVLSDYTGFGERRLL